MKILLVEDHRRLAEYLCQGLKAAHFTVDHFERGADVLAAIGCSQYDAAVLDLGLPDMEGLAVLKTLREAKHSLPVLILTSRIQVSDRVKGLEAGADDYMTKPFAMEELVARLRALLRRPAETLDTVYELGNLFFDSGSREASVSGAPLQLSPREASLLEHLLRRSGKVVPKTSLENSLYEWRQPIASNSLEVLVHRLRKKLNDADANVSVHTVRGVGYLLAERVP